MVVKPCPVISYADFLRFSWLDKITDRRKLLLAPAPCLQNHHHFQAPESGRAERDATNYSWILRLWAPK